MSLSHYPKEMRGRGIIYIIKLFYFFIKISLVVPSDLFRCPPELCDHSWSSMKYTRDFIRALPIYHGRLNSRGSHLIIQCLTVCNTSFFSLAR